MVALPPDGHDWDILGGPDLIAAQEAVLNRAITAITRSKDRMESVVKVMGELLEGLTYFDVVECVLVDCVRRSLPLQFEHQHSTVVTCKYNNSQFYLNATNKSRLNI